MKNRTSNFTTIGGLIFLAVLVIYSNAMGYRRIAGFLVFFLIMAFCSRTWGRASLKKLHLQLQREDLCAFPGESLPVQLTLSNRKYLPVTWIDILFPLPQNGCIVPEDDTLPDTYDDRDLNYLVPVLPRKLSWLMPQQEIVWDFQVRAASRGIHLLKHVYLESGDGFGLSVQGRKMLLDSPKQLTIYPRRLPVDISRLLHQNPSEAQGGRGYQEDISLLKHSRSYQNGDSVRRINWRLLARTQTLMVNEYETISPLRMGFFLDLESFVTLQEKQNSNGGTYQIPTLHRQEMEDMISLVASCICELTARRIACALLLPAYEGHEAETVSTQDLDFQVPLLLERLAAIDYEKDHWQTSADPAQLRRFRHSIGQLYVAGLHAGQLHLENLRETFSPHLFSYLVYQHVEGEQKLERPVYSLQELSFAGSSDFPAAGDKAEEVSA